MRHLRCRQGDLFEARRRPGSSVVEIGPEDRAKLLALLQALLREALAVPAASNKGKNLAEAGNDQDHA